MAELIGKNRKGKIAGALVLHRLLQCHVAGEAFISMCSVDILTCPASYLLCCSLALL